MAFKSYAKANISVAATPTTITQAVTTGNTATVIGMSIANTSANAITVSAKLNKNGADSSYLVTNATVLPGGAIVLVGSDQKVVLEANDTVTAWASVASSADAIVSYLIDAA